MPPGPKGLPLVGNKYQVPSIKPWRTFAAWNGLYGMYSTGATLHPDVDKWITVRNVCRSRRFDSPRKDPSNRYSNSAELN